MISTDSQAQREKKRDRKESDQVKDRKRVELSPELFDTPELKRSLAISIFESGEPVPPELMTAFRETARDSLQLMGELQEAKRREARSKHPPLLEAVRADARIYLGMRSELGDITSAWDLCKVMIRLSWTSDTFGGLLLYRLRTWLLRKRISLLPNLIHRFCMLVFQISIGDPVVIRPGVYFPHGGVVIDGATEIGSGTVVAPWVTIGLREGEIEGPKLGENVFVGTGAKIFGPIQIGSGTRIGANAVVIHDAEPNISLAGVPAEVVKEEAREENE